jgi:hypothetical protein
MFNGLSLSTAFTGLVAAFLTQEQENQPEAIKTAREWTQQFAQKK